MKERLNVAQTAPGAIRAQLGVHAYLDKSGLEHSLLHLIYLRASQINGCAYCIDMHWKDARHAGISEQKLALVPAWREFAAFTDRERAALEWTEAVTLITEGHVPDARPAAPPPPAH